MNTMEELLSDEKVTNDECQKMYNIIGTLEEYVYSSIDDIRIKGVDSMLQEKIVFRDDRIRAEGIAEGEEAKSRKIAEMMISDNEPADKIEKYTGLNLDALKPIAQALGKTLML